MKKNLLLLSLILLLNSSICSQQSSGTFSLSKLFFELTSSQGYTAGRCNKPKVVSDCKSDTSLNYGFYSIFDKSLTSKESLIAGICVSYKKTPWWSSDKGQTIVLIVVTHAAFNQLKLGFNIGDSKSKVLNNRQYIVKNELIKIDLEGYFCILKFDKNNVLVKYIIYPNCSDDDSFQNNWYEKSKNYF